MYGVPPQPSQCGTATESPGRHNYIDLESGINQGMLYKIQYASPSDKCACWVAVKARTMYDLGTGNVSISHGGPFNNTALLIDLKTM